MTSLEEWCAREARRAARRPTLPEALLSGRDWAYAAYRTRFLFARVPIRLALHFAELLLLGNLFPVEDLAPLFAIRATTSVAASLQWGALEPLREDVRAYVQRRSWTSATLRIRAALARSVKLGLLQLGLAIAWIELRPSEFDFFSIFDAYALAAGLRVLLETVARTYAAGISAFRRIPRPFWAGLPGDVMDLCGALLLWPWLGASSFAVALLLAGVIRAGLLVHYARQAYRFSPLKGLELGWSAPRKRVPQGGLGRALGSALANATSQLDAWIVLVLSAVVTTREEGMLIALLHVLRPLLTASIGWSRLFYLDFKSLESRGRLLQERFERFLRRVALAVTAATAALLLLVWQLLGAGPLGSTGFWLLPFLAVRAVFALHQIQAFSYGKRSYLFGTAALVGAGLALVLLVPFVREHALASLTVLLAGVVVGFGAPRGAARSVASGRVGLYRWLSLLASRPGPTRIATARIPRLLTVPPGRVAAELARDRGAPVAVWGQRHLLWFEDADPADRPASPSLTSATAGCLSHVRFGPIGEDGRAALHAALERALVEPALGRRLRSLSPLPRSALADHFRREFPAGTILDAEHGHLRATAGEARGRVTSAAASVRRALGEVLRLTEGPGARSHKDLSAEISVYCPGGEPELVFILPSSTAPETKSAWQRTVEDANLAASLE